MENTKSEKYLGDVISKDGRNLKNIQARIDKGKGIVKKMLDGIPFGKFYFEAAIILRNSLLVSSMLFNCEAWYNITNSEMELLETVDLMLLRGVLDAPQSTPKEMLFLELGVVPFREIVRQRRLGFLYYILHQNKDSLIHKFFESQRKNPTAKDWVTTIESDLKDLNWDIKIEDVQKMKKTEFLSTVKRKIQSKALKDLEEIKQKHSKVKMLKHMVLKMQKYLMPNNYNMKKEDGQQIFKLRSRVTDVKMNMKGLYDMFECEACGKEDESQKHVLECDEILKLNKEYNKMEIPEYEKLLSGNVQDQLKISKIFNSNMKIMETLKNEEPT